MPSLILKLAINALSGISEYESLATNYLEENILGLSEKFNSPLVSSHTSSGNGDGEVGMPDVMFITNHILGSPAASFSIEGADANLDGEVDKNDVKNIVDYLLKGKQWESEE
jgi:hypothetical protein